MAYWLDQLLAELCDFYPPGGPENVLGYLKGSKDPNVWRIKALASKPQYMVLGSIPLTQPEWVAAGKPSSEDTIQTIYMNEIFGFVILFGGIGSKRPWGKLEIPDSDTLKNYKSLALDHFRHQFPRRS